MKFSPSESEESSMSDTSAGRGATRQSTSVPPSQSGMTQVRPIGLQFTETMRGYFSTEVHNDYQHAAERGKQDNSPFEFTLTVTSDDLAQMLEDPHHAARLTGTVTG